MVLTIWTLPDFYLLAGPVSMRARREGGFRIEEEGKPATSLTNCAFLEWDGSGLLEGIIDALIIPTANAHGIYRPYLSALPRIFQVAIGNVKVDIRPLRQLDI